MIHVLHISAEGQPLWEHVYTQNSLGSHVLGLSALPDSSGYAVSGVIQPAVDSIITFIKLISSNGTERASYSFKSSRFTGKRTIAAVSDGIVFVLPAATGPDTLTKIDFNGDVKWKKTIRSSTSAICLTAFNTTDLLVGQITDDKYPFGKTLHVIKFSDSVLVWDNIADYSPQCDILSNLNVQGNEILTTGQVSQRKAIFLQAIDGAGSTLFNKMIGNNNAHQYDSEIAKAVLKTADGNYVIAANTNIFPFDGSDSASVRVMLFKINASGERIW
jgi:hypothetical protein